MSFGVKDGAVLNRKKKTPSQEDYQKYMERTVQNMVNQYGADNTLGWIESRIQFNLRK